MLTLALEFCVQSKSVVTVRKAKLRKWQHTDHLSIRFHLNFLGQCEGGMGLFSMQTEPEKPIFHSAKSYHLLTWGLAGPVFLCLVAPCAAMQKTKATLRTHSICPKHEQQFI